jgi:bifunctional DNA-binding transcriptional regulator/antitoxin component of YhaV-PrlF toxin-antitoxin module
MPATIYGRGQMVIPAKPRKEAHIDTGDVVNVLPEGERRLALIRMERAKPRPRNRFESFAGEENTLCFSSVGQFHAKKYSKRSNNSRRDLSVRRQHADCRNPPKAFGVKTSPWLRPGYTANKQLPAQLANLASCESVAAMDFRFARNRSFVERLSRNLCRNIAVGLSRTTSQLEFSRRG